MFWEVSPGPIEDSPEWDETAEAPVAIPVVVGHCVQEIQFLL